MNILAETYRHNTYLFNIIFSLDCPSRIFIWENIKRYLTERFSSKDNNMSHYTVRAWHAQHSIPKDWLTDRQQQTTSSSNALKSQHKQTRVQHLHGHVHVHAITDMYMVEESIMERYQPNHQLQQVNFMFKMFGIAASCFQ